MKKVIIVWLIAGAWSFCGAVTLQVKVSDVAIPGTAVGTQFDVPVYVQIPDGATNQGLARLYVRIVSRGSTNIMAPVPDGTRVTTTWAPRTSGLGARLRGFLRDLDGDGDVDAADAAVADLGTNTDRGIGIGGWTLVMTQRWQLVGTAVPGTVYTLGVEFPATQSRYYSGAGAAVTFDARTGVDGSVTVTANGVQGTVVLGDYIASRAGVAVTFGIKNTSTGALLETRTLPLDANGAYSYTTGLSAGTYVLTAKAGHWLGQKVTGAIPGTINFNLTNGDCDNSNTVDSADLAVLLPALDSEAGGGTWNMAADVDGDAEVTSADLAIVLANLDRIGD